MAPDLSSREMTKPESSHFSETKSLGDKSSRHGTALTATKRIDTPHTSCDSVFESPVARPMPTAAPVADESAAEQIRLQADQLASHLRDRQKELDYREAELNSRIARFESEARASRLWLDERETDLASRGEDLAKQRQELAARSETLTKTEREVARQQQEVERRLARLAAAEAAQQKHASAPTTRQEEELRCLAETLATRKKQIEEAEARLTEAQAETQKLHEQLAGQRQTFVEETTAMREQMAAEHRQTMADLEQQRQAVQRRADHVDHCRAALAQLRGELGRMHRETLEVRLATEELWAQLSGAAPPAALTRSLGRIRTKLAEQYAQANAELADQRKELEAIRSQLVRQHETLVEQKRSFEQWTAGRQEEGQQQASRLVAREQQLHHEEIQLREQSQRWQAERMKYQQELRRMRAGLAAREGAAAAAD